MIVNNPLTSSLDKANAVAVDEILQHSVPFITLDFEALQVERLENRLSLTKHGCIWDDTTDFCDMNPERPGCS